MNIELKDNLVFVDGIEYIPKEKTLPSEYEIRRWYKGQSGNIFRIKDIVKSQIGTEIWWDNDGIRHGWFHDKSAMDFKGVPATPTEIEAHLRKICDEKYVGKKVRSLVNLPKKYIDRIQSFFEYDEIDDKLWYRGESYGVIVYQKGKWAEILPDKKPVPTNRKEFNTFLGAWNNRHTHTTDEFLDQYDFND